MVKKKKKGRNESLSPTVVRKPQCDDKGVGTSAVKETIVDSIEANEVESSASLYQTLGDEDTVLVNSHLDENIAEPEDGASQEVQQEEEIQKQKSAAQVFDKMPSTENLNKTLVLDTREPPAPKKGYDDCLKGEIGTSDRILLKDAGFEDEDPNPEDLVIEPRVIDEFETSIAHYLVGRVSGRFLGQKAIMNCVSSWNCSLSFHPRGWTVLKFHSIEDRDRVLENGSYFIFGRPFFVRVMPQLFDFNNEEILRTPILIRFPNLPLQLWNAEALSLITSKFGRPLYSDKKTRTKERIAFARVLVEVDVTKGKKSQICLKLPNGNNILQEAIYEYWPRICSPCKAMGRLAESCQVNSGKARNLAKAGPSNVNAEKSNATATQDKPEATAGKALDTSTSSKQVRHANPHQNNNEKIDIASQNRAEQNSDLVRKKTAAVSNSELNSIPKGKEKLHSEPQQLAAVPTDLSEAALESEGKEKAADPDQPEIGKLVHWQEAGANPLLRPIPENEDLSQDTLFEKPKRKNKIKSKATAIYEDGNSEKENPLVLGIDKPSKGAFATSKKQGKGHVPSTNHDNC